MIKLDDHIPDTLVKYTDTFKHIHPNVVTTLGLICNYFILLQIEGIKTQKIDPYLFGALIMIRCATDCIDGAVARKYKKTSKAGNFLDTTSDMIFMFIIFYTVMVSYNLKNWTIIFYLIGLYVLCSRFHMFHTHEIVKSTNGNTIEKIIGFASNNSVLVFAAFYIFVLYTNNKFVQ